MGLRWKLLSKRWEARAQGQLKNRWYSVGRHRLHGHIANHHQLAHILGQRIEQHWKLSVKIGEVFVINI
jgi:hypothetical protein